MLQPLLESFHDLLKVLFSFRDIEDIETAGQRMSMNPCRIEINEGKENPTHPCVK
jgi:hypothetical protein